LANEDFDVERGSYDGQYHSCPFCKLIGHGVDMNQKCCLRLLTQEEIKSIHQRSLGILEKVGVNVHSPVAIEILADSGCRVEGQRVHFPALLVEKLCQIKQKSVVLHSRTGRYLESGTGEIYAHNTGIVSTIADAKTGKQREATLQDAVALVKLMDALDNIHAITPIVYPQDVEPQLALLYAVRELFKNTSKPFRCPFSNAEQFYVSLKKRGIEAILVIYPGESHHINNPATA